MKILFSQKPLFPVIDNHDVMKLLLRPQTPYRNLAGSSVGLNNFQNFFNWEEFLASGKIICAVPGKISRTHLKRLEAKFSVEDRKLFDKLYTLFGDTYCLKLYQNLINRAETTHKDELKDLFGDFYQKEPIIAQQAAEFFSRLGYRVLPVISSDNFICYELQVGKTLLLFLDSMARG